jgi:hypothetical protein
MRKTLLCFLMTAALVFAGEKTKTYKVSGFVGESSSQPASGVAVVLIDQGSGETVGTDETNFFGKYTIKEVPPGTYLLRVEKIERPVGVKDKNVRLDIDLSARTGTMDYAKTGIEMINRENEAGKEAGGPAGAPGGPPGPSDPGMMQSMAGAYYSYSGSTEKKITFCPGGSFFDSSESSYSGKGYDSLGNENLAWGNASQSQGSGQWSIQGNAQNGTITLRYKSGKQVNMKYTPGPEKGCYKFDGTLFCYSGPARCQ